MTVFKGTQVKISLDTKQDMSSATSPEIHYKKPDGTTGEWSGSTSGNNVEYTTSTSDLDVTGDWELQAVATVGGNLVKGEKAEMTVATAIKYN